MTDDLERRLRRDLESGEQLLWMGRPASGFCLRREDTFLIPLSLLWGGFAIFWEAAVLQREEPGWFALWGIPFVLMGLYLIVGRFVVDAVWRARTLYALSDRRVVVVSGLWTREARSIWLRTLTEITVREGRRLGTVELGSTALPMRPWNRGAGWPGMWRYQPPAIELIENSRKVYDLIRSARQAATAVASHR